MLRYFITSFLLFQAIAACGQEQQQDLLETDSSWGREVFSFPLNFAPGINLQGWEEAVFPPNWAKKDSSEFWSYAFAWQVDLTAKLTVADLENYLQLYFDGLMQGVNQGKETTMPATDAHFRLKRKAGSIVHFRGEVAVFDAFFTQNPLILHVSVEQHVCSEHQKSLVLFRLSPRRSGDKVWKQLEKVKPRKNVCGNF